VCSVASIDIKKDGEDAILFYVSEFGFLSGDVYFSALEADGAVGSGKQGEVSAHTDVDAGEEFCAALPDDD